MTRVMVAPEGWVVVRTARVLADLDACLRVRREVFIKGQCEPEAQEVDGLDAERVHFIAEQAVNLWVRLGSASSMRCPMRLRCFQETG